MFTEQKKVLIQRSINAIGFQFDDRFLDLDTH